jgi:serine/threonine protein kinase
MGITYKAVDTVLNRPVALKVISTELLNSSQAKHRFLRIKNRQHGFTGDLSRGKGDFISRFRVHHSKEFILYEG